MKGRVIKHKSEFFLLAIVLMVIINATLALFLWWEYRFFHQQSCKVIELQEQYRAMIEEIKKKEFLSDKNSTISLPEQDSAFSFPAGARIFSTDNDDDEDEGAIDADILLNRRLTHLKKETLAYFKAQRLQKLAQQIDENEWRHYHDQLLSSGEKSKPKEVVVKARRKKQACQVRTIFKDRRVTQAARQTSGIFSWPIDRSSFWISSFFGPRKKPNGRWGFHYALDLAAVRGTPVGAAGSGKVVQAAHVAGYGNTVVIDHGQGYKTRYAHLDKIFVKVGDRLKTGESLGSVGSTGYTIKSGRDASHLHFEVYERGKQINPLYVLAV